ncbi:MAG: hypothetical protein AAF634_18245 [Bacteroidota bacterium]
MAIQTNTGYIGYGGDHYQQKEVNSQKHYLRIGVFAVFPKSEKEIR